MTLIVFNMKYLIILALATYLFVSCEPPKEIGQQGNFIFPASVVNPRDTINLGDSVCFIFEIPDTINLNGTTKIKPFYGSSDGVSLSIEDSKMDTTLGGESRGFTPDCDTYATPGTILNDLKIGIVNSNKLYSKFYMIPKKKGVYFLSVPQAGYFTINNGSITGRVLFTLNTPDKHHTLLINTARPQNRASFAAFIQAQESLGKPIYGFAVR
jgi:hypothetical protein